MTTPNLTIPHLVAGAIDPELQPNHAFDMLDHALNSFVAINFATDADLTLSTTGNQPQQWQYGVIELTDLSVLLTGAKNVIVPDNQRVYNIVNSTAQTLTVKTAAGTGIAIAASGSAHLFCDGTNVRQIGS